MRVACKVCGKHSELISRALAVCLDCIRGRFAEAEAYVRRAHAVSRSQFNLPEKPPSADEGAGCNLCANLCRMAEWERGFCGVRENQGGKIHHLTGTADRASVTWYHDPLPTNCVADWVCPGCSDSGYPEFTYDYGPEIRHNNLAVFYEACTFDCLYCQNWHFRSRDHSLGGKSAAELAAAVNRSTACICYFGGDPTAQLGHALVATRLARERAKGRVLRICWETNGSMRRELLQRMAKYSLESGGCIKFDLKALDENLHRALCGVSNRQTLANFRWLAGMIPERADPPLLLASTLLVPGYVDAEEVSRIAAMIASLDKDIPYSLLGFHPHYQMQDLPRTSVAHAEEAYQAALAAGLTRVNVGNRHLLSAEY